MTQTSFNVFTIFIKNIYKKVIITGKRYLIKYIIEMNQQLQLESTSKIPLKFVNTYPIYYGQEKVQEPKQALKNLRLFIKKINQQENAKNQRHNEQSSMDSQFIYQFNKKTTIQNNKNKNKFKNSSKTNNVDSKSQIQQISFEQIINYAKTRVQKLQKSQKKIKKNWVKSDFDLLNWITYKYAASKKCFDIQNQFTQTDWRYISSMIPGTNSDICMFKYLAQSKTNVILNSWTQQQSQSLKIIVNALSQEQQKISWKEACQKLYLKCKNYRTPKQCKQHWNSYLNPILKKGLWQVQQDIFLLKYIKQNGGMKRWVQIARQLDGRTQNAIKNRFNLLIQKQKKYRQSNNFQIQQEIVLIQQMIERYQMEQRIKIIQPNSEELRIIKQQKQKKYQKNGYHRKSLHHKQPANYNSIFSMNNSTIEKGTHNGTLNINSVDNSIIMQPGQLQNIKIYLHPLIKSQHQNSNNFDQQKKQIVNRSIVLQSKSHNDGNQLTGFPNNSQFAHQTQYSIINKSKDNNFGNGHNNKSHQNRTQHFLQQKDSICPIFQQSMDINDLDFRDKSFDGDLEFINFGLSDHQPDFGCNGQL